MNREKDGSCWGEDSLEIKQEERERVMSKMHDLSTFIRQGKKSIDWIDRSGLALHHTGMNFDSHMGVFENRCNVSVQISMAEMEYNGLEEQLKELEEKEIK